jgi:hypothetical protein
MYQGGGSGEVTGTCFGELFGKGIHEGEGCD